MKKNILTYILIASIVIPFASCNDSEDEPIPCVGGTGGSLTLVLKPRHHGNAIPNQPHHPDTAYIKFNTLNSPEIDTVNHIPKSYDAIFVGDAGHDHIHVTGLKCGKYYIWCTGLDTSISERVFGGFPFETEQTSGEINIDVAVTEGD